jgi:hypothetical protein
MGSPLYPLMIFSADVELFSSRTALVAELVWGVRTETYKNIALLVRQIFISFAVAVGFLNFGPQILST